MYDNLKNHLKSDSACSNLPFDSRNWLGGSGGGARTDDGDDVDAAGSPTHAVLFDPVPAPFKAKSDIKSFKTIAYKCSKLLFKLQVYMRYSY